MNATKDAHRSTATDGPKHQSINAPTTAPATVPAGVPFEFARRFADQMDRTVSEDFGLGWHLPTALTRGREFSAARPASFQLCGRPRSTS